MPDFEATVKRSLRPIQEIYSKNAVSLLLHSITVLIDLLTSLKCQNCIKFKIV